MRAELDQNGFQLRTLHGVIKHHRWQRRLNRLRAYGAERMARRLIAALERLPGENPSTWMVLCERR